MRLGISSSSVWDIRPQLRESPGFSRGEDVNVRYQGAFAIVKDEWGAETAFPAADIEEVYSEPSYL